jgi:hypothetical protein
MAKSKKDKALVAEEHKEVKDQFAEAKKKRRLLHEAQKKKEAVEDSREEFRKFFIKIKGKLKLGRDLENVIWMHFKASGFDKKEKFQEGINHFGYKL